MKQAPMTWERFALLLNQLFYFKEYAAARNEIRDAAFLETSNSPEHNAVQLLGLMEALYEVHMKAQVPEPKPEPKPEPRKPPPPQPAEEEEEEEGYDEEDEFLTESLPKPRAGKRTSIWDEECYCKALSDWPLFSYEEDDYWSSHEITNAKIDVLIHAWQHGCSDEAMPPQAVRMKIRDPVQIRAMLRKSRGMTWGQLRQRHIKLFKFVMKALTAYHWWGRGQNNVKKLQRAGLRGED